MKRLLGLVQVWLLLAGYASLARAIERFAGAPEPPRLPAFVVVIRPRGWTLDDTDPAEPLRIIDFDPTFNRNDDVVTDHDVAFPTTRLDVN